MIRPGNGSSIYLSLAGQDRLSALAARDATLTVSVISRLEDGRARILLNGKPFTAILDESIPSGSVFRAELRYRGSVLELVPAESPLPAEADAARSARDSAQTAQSPRFHQALRLGLPETPAILSLISFYTGISSRIDPAKIRRLAALAARFSDHSETAAEAAAMLDERGIPPNEENVARLASLLNGGRSQGDTGNRDGDEREAAELFVGKREDGRNWIVIPFTRGTVRPYSGSIRFLIHDNTGVVSGMRIGAVIGSRSVTVALGEFSPTFTVNPSLSSVDLEKITVYYKKKLSEFGIDPFENGFSPVSGYGPVDVKA